MTRKRAGAKAKNTPVVINTPQRGRPVRDAVPLKKRLHALTKYMLDYSVNLMFINLVSFQLIEHFSVKMVESQC